jgi:hypothetical protein
MNVEYEYIPSHIALVASEPTRYQPFPLFPKVYKTRFTMDQRQCSSEIVQVAALHGEDKGVVGARRYRH